MTNTTMKDKNFIKKYGLTEAVKRFNMLNEYTFITTPAINEDGEEEDGQQPQGNAPQNNQPMPQGGQPDGGQQSPMGNNQPQIDGKQPMGGTSAQPDAQGGGNMPPMDAPQAGGEQPMDDAPVPTADDMGGDMTPDGEEIEDVEMEGEEDEVVDVDELTDAQESTEYKVDNLNSKLNKLVDVIKDYMTQLDKSNEQIADLKAEFARRNPTPEEKLNLRSQSSYPYSETPSQFWEKKTEENPYYNVIADNEVSPANEEEKFEIKNADVDGFDMKSIADSFDEPMKLDKFFNF